MATNRGPAASGPGKRLTGRKEARPKAAPEPDKSEALAKMALRPSVNAAAVVSLYAKPIGIADTDICALMDRLSDEMEDMWAGDMKRAEAMLYGQAHALQAIFMTLARRAEGQQYLKQWEAYLRMALKAQNQCRMTLETLATIKNPPVVYARQANINHGGQQQVNNGGAGVSAPVRASAPAPAANVQDAPTGLLELSKETGPADTAPAGSHERAQREPIQAGKSA